MPQSLIPNAPTNNTVYTPPILAKKIIDHYKPTGVILEPCSGMGAFYQNFPGENNKWCEIDKGVNFFDFKESIPWIVSNPPWGKPYFRQFLRHSMELSENVIFLCLINAFFQNSRLNDLEEFGFGIKEILYIPKNLCPGEKDGWPSLGMSLGATHIQKGYSGDIKFSKLQ